MTIRRTARRRRRRLSAFLAARDVTVAEIDGDPAAAIRDRRIPVAADRR